MPIPVLFPIFNVAQVAIIAFGAALAAGGVAYKNGQRVSEQNKRTNPHGEPLTATEGA